jgi:EAL domain-containing protein (putative c-di-GMP-specific phosphodiesterase class I)
MNQLKTLLSRIATGERWKEETRFAKQIQTALKDSLPAELVDACEAWQSESETLTLSCPSGIYASKLRQFTPRIIQHLKASGVEVRAIRIEVQAARAMHKPLKVKQTLARPGALIVKEIEELGSQVSTTPLGSALKKLANTLRQK